MKPFPFPVAADKLLDDYIINISNQGGGDCSTLAEAVAIRNSDPSVTVRYKLLFSAGEKHIVDNSAGPIVIPENTELDGDGGLLGSTVEFTDNTKDGLQLSGNCQLRNLILQYATAPGAGTGVALVVFAAGGGTNNIEWIFFSVTDQATRIESGDVTLHECRFISFVSNAIVCTGTGSVKVVDCQFSSNVRAIQALTGSVVFLKNSLILAATDCGVFQDGGSLQIEGGSLFGCRDGINVASGALTTQGIYIAGSTRYDINQSTSAGIPVIQSCYANTAKFNITNKALFAVINVFDISHLGTDNQRFEISASGGITPLAKYNTFTQPNLVGDLPDCSSHTEHYPAIIHLIDETLQGGTIIRCTAGVSNTLEGGTATTIEIPQNGSITVMGYQGAWKVWQNDNLLYADRNPQRYGLLLG